LGQVENDQFSWAYTTDIEKDSDLTLLDNVQFIYELSLAELELEALGAEYQVTNGPRKFLLLNKNLNLFEKIKTRSAYFKSVNGEFTDYYKIIQKNRTRSVNQYLTHWIYPYKGKFHPQMIRALLNVIGLKKGDLLFEPFSGSGTAAIEAQLLGIDFYGIDISPLCVLQGKVKTQSIFALSEIIRIRDNIIYNKKNTIFEKEKSLSEAIDNIENSQARDFYSMAKLLSVSDNARRGRDIEKSFYKNLLLMIESVTDYKNIIDDLRLELGVIIIEEGDCRNVKINDNSVDGIITSPPYSKALDYVENDSHSLTDMGYELEKIKDGFIGVRGMGKSKVDLYNEDMKKAYSEMYRVLKPDKYAVIVIGNASYQAEEVKTVEFTINYMESIGFELSKNILKPIFGLYNVMKKESMLIFKKTG
jgi:DNA modification methylase